MGNPFFRFKQFMVVHEKAAMKVGTDGVMLGAWAGIDTCTKALDIGTGSGLIALMLAQRGLESIDAVEIDPEACVQAEENFKASPWPSKIHIVQTSFQEFQKNNQKKYDLIVCNPPYFDKSLRANGHQRAMARDSFALPTAELLSGVACLVNPAGRFCMIAPFEKYLELFSLAKNHKLFITRETKVNPTPEKPAKRVLLQMEFIAKEAELTEMVIETGSRHQYSDEYKQLTRDFYLDL